MVSCVLTEVSLEWVASILAPHLLEVGGADWAIRKEHGIQLGVVSLYTKQKLAQQKLLGTTYS